MGLAIAISAVATLLVVALALNSMIGPPAGGLSQSAAEKIAATSTFSTTSPRVTLARLVRLSEFAQGNQAIGPGKWAWAVYFTGNFPPPSCGPFPLLGQTAHCPAPEHTELVMIDYFNGRWISTSVPAPTSSRPAG